MILIGESKVKGTQPLLSRYSYWNLREKESSVAQLCLTLCDLMACSTPGFPVHHQLPEPLMSIASVMPSNHLILCRPILLLPSIFPSIILMTYFNLKTPLESRQTSLAVGSTQAWFHATCFLLSLRITLTL